MKLVCEASGAALYYDKGADTFEVRRGEETQLTTQSPQEAAVSWGEAATAALLRRFSVWCGETGKEMDTGRPAAAPVSAAVCAICGARPNSFVQCPREGAAICHEHCAQCEHISGGTSVTRCRYRNYEELKRIEAAKETIRALCESAGEPGRTNQ